MAHRKKRKKNISYTEPTEGTGKVYRATRVRIVADNDETFHYLDRIAWACKEVYNEILRQKREEYREHRDDDGWKPDHSPSDFNRRFKELRNEEGWEYLKELPYDYVRESLYDQQKSWQRYEKYRQRKIRNRKNGLNIRLKKVGMPQKKRKLKRQDTEIWTHLNFCIPSGVARIKKDKIWLVNKGWVLRVRRNGADPYAGEQLCWIRMKKRRNVWVATLHYKIDAPEKTQNGVVAGVDCNVGQNTYLLQGEEETHKIHNYPHAKWQKERNQAKDERRLKKYQRQLARQTKFSGRWWVTTNRINALYERMANRRHNENHHLSKELAESAQYVFLELLQVMNMIRSARGTKEKPGKNVAQKRGLNRSIVAMAWYQLYQMCLYKCFFVERVPPQNTSQRCSSCNYVHKLNRPRRDDFVCTKKGCDHKEHADVNAARNIMRQGLARMHEEGVSPAPRGLGLAPSGVGLDALNRESYMD